jgi:hypothetical protein
MDQLFLHNCKALVHPDYEDDALISKVPVKGSLILHNCKALVHPDYEDDALISKVLGKGSFNCTTARHVFIQIMR